MQTLRLYLLLFAGVLWAAGCAQDRSNSESARAASDTSTTASRTAPSADTAAGDGLRVLVLGNSIAAGLGVSSEAAFPARLQQKVDSLGWNVTVQNAGVSGETTAGGLRRIEWLLNEEVDVLVLELGGNDGLRGVPPSDTKANLTGIIDTTLAAYPEARVLLTAMRIPKNLGPDYTERFRRVYPAVARQYDRVSLVQFDRRLQAGADSLMQDDGIHPTAAGHRLVARDMWARLRPLLEKMRARTPA
ncbi:MAG: arylesterase [Salinibacter sp.]